MLKKIIPIILSICLIFSLCAATVYAVNEPPAEIQQGRGERGGRPPMDRMPSGDFTPPEGGFTPPEGGFTPPEGDFKPPEGDFTPPEGGFTPRGDFKAEEITPPPNSEKPAIQEQPKTDGNITEEAPKTQEDGETPPESSEKSSRFGGQMPEGMEDFFGNMQGRETKQTQPQGFLGFVKTYSTPIISVVLLFFAYIFVFFYKRKNY